MRRIAAVALAVAGLLASVPTDARPLADGSTEARRILALHEAERATVGVGPLAWNGGLAADADRWARTLAAADRIWHDPANRGQGENIWIGTRGAYTIDEMVGGWSAEKRDLPDLSPHWFGRLERVGHYTQMIWRGTTAVGCALASSRRSDVLVCRYAPPGNIVGRAPVG